MDNHAINRINFFNRLTALIKMFLQLTFSLANATWNSVTVIPALVIRGPSVACSVICFSVSRSDLLWLVLCDCEPLQVAPSVRPGGCQCLQGQEAY